MERRERYGDAPRTAVGGGEVESGDHHRALALHLPAGGVEGEEGGRLAWIVKGDLRLRLGEGMGAGGGRAGGGEERRPNQKLRVGWEREERGSLISKLGMILTGG